MSKSILSAGEIIRHMLLESQAVAAITNKVFPVAVDNADLPYIVYRRMDMRQVPTANGRGADTGTYQVLCCADGYTASVDLAEAVREAIDGKQGEYEGLRLRMCNLTNSDEAWDADAFVQRLIFTIKI